MELKLTPLRVRRHPVLVVVAVVLAGWLAALLLIPPVLGVHTGVAGSASAGLGTGSLVVTRGVPSGDLAADDEVAVAGDVRRVSATEPGVIRVDGTAPILTTTIPTLDRVVVVLPLVGLPLTGIHGLMRWLLGGVVALAALAISLGDRPASRRSSGRVRLAA